MVRFWHKLILTPGRIFYRLEKVRVLAFDLKVGFGFQRSHYIYVTVYEKTRHVGFFAKIAIALFINSTTLELTLLQL